MHSVLSFFTRALIDRGSASLQLNLEFDGPIRWHPLQIIRKHIRILTDHRYLIQTLCNNSVNRCLETSNRKQLQRNLVVSERIKMNQTSRDIQYCLMPHHPAHTKNNIYPLAFQDDKTGQNCSPNKLEWDFTDHTIGNHLPSEGANIIWCVCSPKSQLSLLSTG
jgi:hypothetical protein